MGNGINGNVLNASNFNTGGIDDALAPWLMTGSKWGSAMPGNAINVTFSFSDENSRYRNDYGFGEQLEGFGLTAQQKTALDAIMDNYEAVANIGFTEAVESNTLAGDIRFANTTSNEVPTAWGYYPNDTAEAGDVWFGDNGYLNPHAGNYAWHTHIHELGHALGLKHPHENPSAPNSRDAMKFTVMSYKDHVGDATFDGYETAFFATTLMMDDIIALQTLYGVNNSTDSGNTTYTWGSDQMIYETIWDGGGVDTIDASNQARKVIINLGDGTFSAIGKAFWNGQANVRDCLGIAFNCDIENATGSAYADTLTGNELGNVLIGGKGKDVLNGRTGNDTLNGGGGADTFRFDTALNAGTNVDTVLMKAGSDNITLENSIFAQLSAGTLGAANFRANASGTAADANDYIVYNTTTGELFYDSNGSGAGSKTLFAMIGTSTHPALTAADFAVT